MVRPRNLPIEPMRDTDVDWFYRFVDRRGVHECWPWLGGCDPRGGRGIFSLRCRSFIAPRVACYLATGVDPGDRMVCHTRNCNNPNCCNPRHLYPGTPQDNARDRLACGRQARGERHGNAKLTDELAAQIRRRYASERISQRALAGEYRVCQRTITKVVNHKSYIPGAPSPTDTSAATIPTP